MNTFPAPKVAANWTRLAHQYARFSAPLRPDPEDVALFSKAVHGHGARVLLLGVTPALAGLGDDLLAVEAMPDVIAALWPGDNAHRHAVVGDWRALPCHDQSRSAIVGDGVLSAVDADPGDLLQEFLRVLEPGGVIAIRCFCAPDCPEPLDLIIEDATAGRVPNMNVLKWRLSMHRSGNDPLFRVPVLSVLELFNRLFPDRTRFLEQTGWQRSDFDFIDLYRGSDSVLRFLSEDRLRAVFMDTGFRLIVLKPQGYPLADRSPLFVLHKSVEQE